MRDQRYIQKLRVDEKIMQLLCLFDVSEKMSDLMYYTHPGMVEDILGYFVRVKVS